MYAQAECDWDDRTGKGRYLSLIHICAVIPAVAEGVDGLQRVCRHEVWVGLDPSIVRCVQAQGRLHRTGQTGTVVRWLLQCPGTVDTESVIPRLDQRYADLKVSGLI